MHPAFEVHMLTEDGKRKASDIALAFDGLVLVLDGICPKGAEWFRALEKLEEACFLVKKALAKENCK